MLYVNNFILTSDFGLQYIICKDTNCLDLSGNSVDSEYWTTLNQKIGANVFWMNETDSTNFGRSPYLYGNAQQITVNTNHARYHVLCK